MKLFHPCPALFLGVSFLLSSLVSGHAANFSITTTANDGVGSLRQAFADAEAAAGADTIFFDETIAGQTITLTESISVSGIVTLNGVSTSSGSVLSAGMTISGGGTTRLFDVAVGADFSVFNVTLTGGFSGGGAGAISNTGTVFLSACTLHGNSGGFGGAIYSDVGATLILRNCTLTSNTASVSGGAIVSNGSLSLTHCTVVGNMAVSNGGGLFFNDQTTVTQCILYGNTAGTGGDVNINADGSMIRVGLNIIGSLAGFGAGSTSGPAALTSDPLLAPLGHYGGLTQTMPPLNGSPAIDPVGGATTSALGSDQRSSARVLDATGSGTAIVDIGSVETGDFVVKNAFDGGRDSLRGVIQSAVTPGQVITFDPVLNGSTIGFTDEIVLNKNVVLDARDLEDGITLSGGFANRHFYVNASRSVEMHRLKFVDGRGRGAGDDGSGGAIANRGSLVLNECSLSGNRAEMDNNSRGGAVFSSDGSLTLTNCTLNGNFAKGSGGGIHSNTNLSGQKTRLSQCTLTGNSTEGRGGAVNNFDGLTELIQCTLTGNVSATDSGGGVASYGDNSTETVCVNTIIAGNISSDVDLVTNDTISNNSFTSQGHNLIGSGSGLTDFNQTGDQTEVADPLLAPLADNGGPTRTRLPMPESLALDAGGATDLTTDQRGFARVVDGDEEGGAIVDIGAAESTASDFIAGAVSFAESQVKKSENAGTVNVTLSRTGGSFGEITVQVNSTAGTATSGTDFEPLTDVLVTFAAGQTDVSIPVTLLADPDLKEPHETFTLNLSAPTGDATLGLTPTLSFVILDAVDDKVPTVTVTSPKNNAAVAETDDNDVLITGTAKDDKGIHSIVIQINGGPLSEVPVVSTDIKNGTWSILMPAVAGINTLTLYSQDDLGNPSKTLVSRFNYQVLRPLIVNVSGPADSGTVTQGFMPASDRLLGVSYKISATAKAGFVFSGWTANSFAGTGVTDAAKELPALTFIMQPGLVLTANFIANPFTAEIAGSYNGLVKPDDTAPEINATVGLLTASVTTKGSFSGKLKLDGATHSVSGVLTSEGESRFGKTRTPSLTIKRKGKSDLLVSLSLDLEDGVMNGQVMQTLPGEVSAVSSFAATRAHYSSKAKVPENLAGTKGQRYNVAVYSLSFLNPSLDTSEYPQGTGTLYMKVSPTGVVSYSGKLADNTAVTGSAPLSETDQFPLFVQLYKLAGSFSGNVLFNLSDADSDLNGSELTWYRPAQPASQYYPDGWTESFNFFLAGARYQIPENSSVITGLGAVDENGNASLIFEGGLITGGIIEKTLNVSADNVITKLDPLDKSFTIKLNKSTGDVTGTFTHNDGKIVKYQATVLQKGGAAGVVGFFLSPPTKPLDFAGESGYVSLFPNGEG